MAVRLLLLLLVPAIALAQPEEQDVSVQSSKVSCTSGPYRVKLPKTYKGLRRMAVLKREKVLDESDYGTFRELRFVGLELVVLTKPGRPNDYQLARAFFTTSKWRIMGPLRVGAPARLALKGLPVSPMPRFGSVTLEGDADSVLLTVSGGRLQEIEYECATDEGK
ncbi:MAG TPA: hypothetical protein VEB41_06670 [Burkholderiales bacterium]|nr:hypothetical protein [Burkholderiales bacterium]